MTSVIHMGSLPEACAGPALWTCGCRYDDSGALLGHRQLASPRSTAECEWPGNGPIASVQLESEWWQSGRELSTHDSFCR